MGTNWIRTAGLFLAMMMIVAGAGAVGAEEDKTAPAAAAVAPAAKPEGEKIRPTADVTISVLSAYISKGDELSRNSIVVQPQFAVGYQGFYFNIWGNLDTRPYLAETSVYKGDKRQNWTETDVNIGYNRSFGMVNAGIAYAYFGNAAFWNSDATGAGPDQKDDQEVSVSLGLDTLLSPNLKAARSFDSTQIWYFLLSVSHTFALNKLVGLSLSASASYLLSQDDNRLKTNSDGTTSRPDGSPNGRYNNFHDAVIALGLPVKPTSYLTITPQLSYVFPMCDDAKYDMRSRSMQIDTVFADRQSSYLVGGVTAALSF